MLALLSLSGGCYYFQDDIDRIVHPPKTPKPAPAYTPTFRFQGTVQGDPKALSVRPGPAWFRLQGAWADTGILRDLAGRDLSALQDQVLGEELRVVFRARGSELALATAAREDGSFLSEAVALESLPAGVQSVEVAVYRISRPEEPLARWLIPLQPPGDGDSLIQEVFLREDKTVLVRSWRRSPGEDGPTGGLVVTVDTDAAGLGVAAGASGGVWRLSGADGLHLFDVDGDGIWGEPDDDAVLPSGLSWSQAAAQVVDIDLDGVPEDPSARNFGAGLTVQDAVGELSLVLEPAPLAAGGPGALLRVLAAPAPGVGLPLGARVEVAVTGASVQGGTGHLLLDRTAGWGRAEGRLVVLAPAQPGEVRIEARVTGRRDQDLTAFLRVPVVEAAAALSVVELALDRNSAVPGQSLYATVRVRNDAAEDLEVYTAGLVSTVAGIPSADTLRVQADPDNPTRVEGGRTALFRYTLELAPAAPAGTWDLEAYLAGRMAGVPVHVRGTGKAYRLAVVPRARLLLKRVVTGPVLAPGESGAAMEVEIENTGGSMAALSSAGLRFQDPRLSATRTDTVAEVAPGATAILAFDLAAGADLPLIAQDWALAVDATDAHDGRPVVLEQTTAPAALTVQPKTPAAGKVLPAQVVATAADAGRTFEVQGALFFGLESAWLEGAVGRVDLEILDTPGDTSFKARVPAGATPGIYSLRVHTASGDSPPDGPTFQVLALPEVATLSPDAVALGREGLVTLTGQHLAGVGQVHLAGAGGRSFDAVLVSAGPDRLVLRTPATLPLGGYEVVLVTAAGETPTGYSLRVLEAPRVTRLEPDRVPAGQALPIEIHGERFAGPVDRLTLSDGTPLAVLQKPDEYSVQATVPGTVKPGIYQVQLSTAWLGRGTSDAAAVLIVHRGDPTVRVNLVEPEFGPEGQAQTVTVGGENFMGATAVALVDNSGAQARVEAVSLFHVDSDLQLTATIPASVPAGEYELVVTTPLAASAGGARFRRLLASLPTTRECMPSTGSTDQDTAGVLLTGTGFAPGLTRAHLVDGTSEHEVVVTSVAASTMLRMTVPQGLPSGIYSVRATTDGRVGVETRARFVVNPPGAVAVSKLDPAVKRQGGNRTVQVDGRNFTGAQSARWKQVTGGGLELGAAEGVTVTVLDGEHATVAVPEALDSHPGEYELLVIRDTGSGTVENVASAVRLRVPGDPRVTGLSGSPLTEGETPQLTITGRDLYDPLRVELVDVSDGSLHGTLTGTAVVVPAGTALTGLRAPAALEPGEYWLRVVTPFGSGAGNQTSGRTLLVLAAPEVTGVGPRGLDRARGGTLQVEGQHFRAGMQVGLVSGTETRDPTRTTVVNPTLLEVQVPPGLDAGAWRVQVQAGSSPAVHSDEVWLQGVPVIDGVQPPSVPSRTATPVQVSGSLFQVRDQDGVLVPAALPAQVPAWWVDQANASLAFPVTATITAAGELDTEVPDTLPVGGYALRLDNAWGRGEGGALATAGPPVLTALDEQYGDNTGPTPLNVYGRNFVGVTRVEFRALGAGARSFDLQAPASYTAGSLSVTVPAGKYPGPYYVVVHTPAGDTASSAPEVNFKITASAAVFDAIQPARGPNDRAVPVRITGSHLLGASEVTVGGKPLAGLDASQDGVITGEVPEGLKAGTYAVSIDTYNGDLTVAGAWTAYAPLAPPAATLRPAETGLAYDQTLSAAGGWAPVTWSTLAGDWPNGLSLGTDGRILGTPQVAGDYAPQVQATDADGNTVTQTLDLHVAGWEVLAGSGAGGTVPAATGGQTAVGGMLAPALALDPDDRPVLAWRQGGSQGGDVFLRAWDGAAWQERAGSATSTGLGGGSGALSVVVDGNGRVLVGAAGGGGVSWIQEFSNGTWQFMPYAGPATLLNNVNAGVSHLRLGLTPGGMPLAAFLTDPVTVARYENGTWSSIGVLDSTATWSGTAWSVTRGAVAPVLLQQTPALAPLAYGGAWVAWLEADNKLYAAHTGSNRRDVLAQRDAPVPSTPRQPSLPVAAGLGFRPRVAWTQGGDLYFKRHDGTAWVELGGSATGQGITGPGRGANEKSLATDPRGRPVLAWRDSLGGIHAVRWNGQAWVGLGGSDSLVVSDTTARNPAVAVDSENRVVLAWQQGDAGQEQVHVQRHTGYGDARDGVDVWNQEVFADNFDSLALGGFPTTTGWTLASNGAGAAQQGVVAEGYGGTRGLRLAAGPSLAAAASREFLDEDADVVTLEARVRLGFPEGTGVLGSTPLARVGFWDEDRQPSTFRAGVVFSADHSVSASTGTWSEPFELDRWYQVRVVHDTAGSLYSLYLDGVLKLDGQPLPRVSEPYNHVRFSAESGSRVLLDVDDVKLYRDPPTRFLSIGSPAPGAVVGRDVTVNGSAVGVSEVEVWTSVQYVTAGGSFITSALAYTATAPVDAQGRWSATLQLGPADSDLGGRLTAVLEARSTDGTVQSRQLTVYRDPPPRLAITSPLNNDLNLAPSRTVSGTAVSLTQVKVWTSTDGGSWTLQQTVAVQAGGTWTATVQVGGATVTTRVRTTVEARSPDGATLSNQVTLLRDPPKSVTLQQVDNTVVNTSPPGRWARVQGTSTGLTQAGMTHVNVNVDGALAGQAPIDASTGNWQAEVPVGDINIWQAMNVTIDAAATDGSVTSGSMPWGRQPPPASIEIRDPTNNATVARSVTVSGRALGMNQVSVWVYTDQWRQQPDGNPGPVAVDGNGNFAVTATVGGVTEPVRLTAKIMVRQWGINGVGPEKTVYRDADTSITITSPSNNTRFDDEEQQISGTATGLDGKRVLVNSKTSTGAQANFQIVAVSGGRWSATLSFDQPGDYTVYAKDADTALFESNRISVKRLAPPTLAPPTLTRPRDQENIYVTSTPTQVGFLWNAVTGASGYDLQIGTGSNLNNYTISNYPNNSAVISRSSGRHYWRVRTRNSADVAGDWSGWFGFWIGVKPRIDVSPGSVNETVRIGDFVVKTFTVTNSGDETLNVTDITTETTSAGSPGFLGPLSPSNKNKTSFSVPGGGSVSFTCNVSAWWFNVNQTGVHKGTIKVHSNAVNSSIAGILVTMTVPTPQITISADRTSVPPGGRYNVSVTSTGTVEGLLMTLEKYWDAGVGWKDFEEDGGTPAYTGSPKTLSSDDQNFSFSNVPSQNPWGGWAPALIRLRVRYETANSTWYSNEITVTEQ